MALQLDQLPKDLQTVLQAGAGDGGVAFPAYRAMENLLKGLAFGKSNARANNDPRTSATWSSDYFQSSQELT